MDRIFKCNVNHQGDKPLGVQETHLQCSLHQPRYLGPRLKRKENKQASELSQHSSLSVS